MADKQVSEQFKQTVIMWVQLDDQLKELAQQSKELKEQKKELDDYILNYLGNIGENSIKITNGNIIRNISKTKVPLKKEHIIDKLKTILKDEEKSKLIVDDIYNSRPEAQKINLKRTKTKK